ncbi:MAG: O-antigen ligase family protein [Terrimicrobiaceae bacterium]
MDWIVAGILVLIGAGLALSRSGYMIDYVLVVYVFNRGLRRVLDYYAGAFNPLSPVSLAPLIITGLMMLPLLQSIGTLPKSSKTILYCLFGAIGYGFLIGFVRVKFAAIYSLGEVLAPIAMFGYILILGANQQTKDRWLRTAAWCAIGASAYGWYQYLTIPPWDAFWVRAVGMEGYLGILEPMKISVFSTMAERGVLGGFLGFAVVPMILSPKWRTSLGWIGVLLVISNILLAQTRTGMILAGLSVMIYVMVNKGTGFLQMAIAFVVITAAAWFGMSRMPGADKLADRFSTIGNIQEDGSFKGRMDIYAYSMTSILLNPIGYGLGATGISSRINAGGSEGGAVITDAGYVEIVAAYGWIGAGLILYALWCMWKQLALRNRMGYRPSEVMLGRAFMIALIPACFVGNVITSFSILWIVFGAALCPKALRTFVLRMQLMQKARAAAAAPAAGQPI